MTLDKLDLFKMKANSFCRVLKQTPDSAKSKNVSIPMSEDFNRLLDEIATSFPDVADAIPKKITAGSDARMWGFADVRLVELEILADQLLGILDLLANKR